MSYIIVFCPSCSDPILILTDEIRCGIFRHGAMKNTGIQMDPHASKEVCDNLAKHKLIYGCGKPFRLNTGDEKNIVAEICDYI